MCRIIAIVGTVRDTRYAGEGVGMPGRSFDIGSPAARGPEETRRSRPGSLRLSIRYVALLVAASVTMMFFLSMPRAT